jgi:hypothetical protein
VDAVVKQLETLPYAYPGIFITEIRARLGKVIGAAIVSDDF